MVVEEFVVIVRGQNGKGKRQFTYSTDPRKKPNAESVLRDFRLEAQIEDERHWRLCTLTGKEIRWLADYADRVLVLEPLAIGQGDHGGLPRLATPAKVRANYDLGNSGSTAILVSTKNHRSSIGSVSSTPKLPSLSTSSGSGSNFLSSSSGSGARRTEERHSRVDGLLPKARDSRPTYVDRDHRNGKSERRERSR